MKKHGKKYRASLEKITQESYTLSDAANLVKDTSTTSFDGSVEIHIRLALDPKKADQQLRTTVNLPHGSGKTQRIVVFAGDEYVKEATEAGAIEAGSDALVDKVKGGWTDFDVAVAHPDMMKEVGKLGKILGTKGLMPNPKSGTVTPDIAKAVKELMGGRVEIKLDPRGIVHCIAGKVSFSAEHLAENLKTILDTIKANKPSGAKSGYIESISVNATMGPGMSIDLNEVK